MTNFKRKLIFYNRHRIHIEYTIDKLIEKDLVESRSTENKQTHTHKHYVKYVNRVFFLFRNDLSTKWWKKNQKTARLARHSVLYIS